MNQEKDIIKKLVKMYVCGPTVYDNSHLGHARTYVMVDLINRAMNLYAEKKTHLVMNITDIDDKIIKKAQETNTDWKDIAKIYEKSFLNSMAKLNVKLPDVIIRVSDVIPKIILYIQKIIDNKFAYITSDGSVYFDSNAYVEHGYSYQDLIDEEESYYQSELSPLILMQKRNKKDFVLWKGRSRLEVGFDSEFVFDNKIIKSYGRPGWHIECSAMIDDTIGSDLDIHLGGIDLKFPHHYNERLQAHAYYHPKFLPAECEAYNGNRITQWTTEFYHIGHLCIVVKNDKMESIQQKMSKSLKNFTTIDDALKTINSNQMRWMFATHEWTDTMDYSSDTIEHAKVFDSTINNFFNMISNYPFDKSFITYNKKEFVLLENFISSQKDIITALQNLQFVKFTEQLKKLINKTNKYMSNGQPNKSLIRKVYDWIFNLVENLGFKYGTNQSDLTSEVMSVLISTRSAIRFLTRDTSVSKEIKHKLFHILDEERNIKLQEIGITLQDTKDSSFWSNN